MKRLLIIMTAVLLIATLAACGNGSGSKKKGSSSKPTSAPTEAPYIDTQINEPEWTLAEGNLQLESGDTVYASGEDVLYFAIVTDTDGKQELRFRLSDTVAATLKEQSADAAYFMTLDGEKLGDATLNDDCTEAVITQDHANGKITTLATKIRGLYS